MAIEVDLFSDTVTKPTKEMRRFMCEAEVGDEQKHEDPSVNQLQEMVAELLGKEAALFLPSGTMCNEIALRVHCRPGEEMIARRSAHPIHFVTGGPAALAGVNVQGLDGPRGMYDAATLEAAIRPENRHMPRSRLVWVEQTSNLGGGSIWPLSQIRAVTDIARRHRLSTHMDGARLMNAVVASRIAARQWRARAISSRRRGAASNRWAGRCARPASLPRAASMPCATMWSVSRRITPTHDASPRGWPPCPGSSSTPPVWRPTLSSSISRARSTPPRPWRASSRTASAWAPSAHGRFAPSRTSTSPPRASRRRWRRRGPSSGPDRW